MNNRWSDSPPPARIHTQKQKHLDLIHQRAFPPGPESHFSPVYIYSYLCTGKLNCIIRCGVIAGGGKNFIFPPQFGFRGLIARIRVFFGASGLSIVSEAIVCYNCAAFVLRWLIEWIISRPGRRPIRHQLQWTPPSSGRPEKWSGWSRVISPLFPGSWKSPKL